MLQPSGPDLSPGLLGLLDPPDMLDSLDGQNLVDTLRAFNVPDVLVTFHRFGTLAGGCLHTEFVLDA